MAARRLRSDPEFPTFATEEGEDQRRPESCRGWGSVQCSDWMPYGEKGKVKPIEEEQENKNQNKCDYTCLSSSGPGSEMDPRFSQPLSLPNSAKSQRKG